MSTVKAHLRAATAAAASLTQDLSAALALVVAADPDPAPTPVPNPPPAPAPVPNPPPGPPAPPAGEGILLDNARTLQPGEWRHIPTVLPAEFTSFQNFQYVRAIPPATGGADGMGWTERIVLHNGELMLLLMRDAFEKSFIRMDRNGVWTRLRQPEGYPARYERRPFNRMVSDGQHLYHFPADAKVLMGYAVRTPLDNPGVFERFGVSIGDDQMDTVGNFATTWSPEWGRFLAYTPGGKIWSWAPGETSWKRHDGSIPAAESPSGYAGTILWNPVRKEALAIGGQHFGSNPDTSFRVMRLRDPAGEAERPFDAKLPDGSLMLAITSGSSRFLVHPTTGEYWCLYRDDRIYRSDTGEHWTLYQDTTPFKPFGNYEKYCPMTWLTDDVIVGVSHIKGVFLHRLMGAVPAPAPSPTPTPPPAPTPSPTPPPPAPTYTLSAQSLSVDEGASAVIKLTTTGVPAGTSIGYHLTGIQPEDVLDGDMTGAFTPDEDGIDTTTIRVRADELTEGAETIHLVLDNDAAEIVITVNDTSVTPAPAPPPPPAVGLIAAAMRDLAPGQMRLISPDTSRFKVSVPDAGSYWIIDWNPRMHWHARTQQLFLFGLRQDHIMSAWLDAEGKWRALTPPPGMEPGAPNVDGHWYGWSAQDAHDGIYVKSWRFDILTEAWTQLPPIPKATNGSHGTMLACMPDRLARYGGDIQRFQVYDPVLNSWPLVVDRIGNGQHALMEYHPAHDKVLICGGNSQVEPDGTSTKLRVHLLTPDGAKQRVANLPEPVSMSSGSWIVAHRSGCWLVRTKPDVGPRKVFAYWPAQDVWQYVCDLPDAQSSLAYMTAALYEDGDAMLFATPQGLKAWRPPALIAP